MSRVTPMTSREQDAYARGCGCFAIGEVDEALETFSSLLETRSDFADVHYMVGVLRDRKGDDAGATESLRRAVRLNPSYAEALLALASVHERRGEYDRSREYAERAAAVSRRDGRALDPTTRGKLANLQAAFIHGPRQERVHVAAAGERIRQDIQRRAGGAGRALG